MAATVHRTAHYLSDYATSTRSVRKKEQCMIRITPLPRAADVGIVTASRGAQNDRYTREENGMCDGSA